MKKFLLFLITVTFYGQADLKISLEEELETLMPKVIEWRHDIHQHPELGNREFRTSNKIKVHLESLGIEVESGIAYTGLVGMIEGGKPGPTIALRADMDALPVEEKTGLSFASKVRTTYLGNDVGVMHACGHDAHTAMLVGAAKVLSEMRDQFSGTVRFMFQPGEEGAGGAAGRQAGGQADGGGRGEGGGGGGEGSDLSLIHI